MLFSNISEDELIIENEFKKNGVIYYEVKTVNRGCRCNKCGRYHTNVKEYITKRINHYIYAHDPCTIIFHHRRFICPHCHSTQMDVNPFVSEGNRVSDKTVENILESIKRYNVTFTQVAEYTSLSTRGVIKIFDKYCQMKRNPFTLAMCFDEIYFSRKRKKKYILVIINFFNRAIIDVLKDRDKSTLSSYLRKIDKKERDRVLYVCIDMNDNYRDILSIYFPNAFIVADSFHVVKRIGSALDDVRKRVMKKYEDNPKSDEYYLLKYRDELLYKEDISDRMKYNHHFKIEMSEFELLEKMKAINSQLNKAYELYHQYIRFNNTDYEDNIECLNDLKELINDFKISGINEFEKVSDTLNYWECEVVNSFLKFKDRRVSNGPIEGRNSMIKKILTLANGYSNFKRFRNRVIYSLNKYAEHNFKKNVK